MGDEQHGQTAPSRLETDLSSGETLNAGLFLTRDPLTEPEAQGLLRTSALQGRLDRPSRDGDTERLQRTVPGKTLLRRASYRLHQVWFMARRHAREYKG